MLDFHRNGAGGRVASRAVGEQSGAAAGSAPPPRLPDPELIERPERRRFTAEYKLQVLREADACTEPGQIGALLRREGLYSSHLSDWRRQRQQGALQALERPRGRPKGEALAVENEALRRKLARAEAELARAQKVIKVQGKVSALLGELLEPRGARPNESSDK